MQLADWLDQQHIKRIDFAERLGVTPQAITGYCDGSFTPRKAVMRKIREFTGGQVTADDFLDLGAENAA